MCLFFGSDFMQAAGAQAELFFWLTVEGYRVTAQQQLEAMHGWQRDGKSQTSATKGLLKAAALGVFEQYLSDKVSWPLRLLLCCNVYVFCVSWGLTSQSWGFNPNAPVAIKGSS